MCTGRKFHAKGDGCLGHRRRSGGTSGSYRRAKEGFFRHRRGWRKTGESKDKSSPGLVFDNSQENGKVEKGEDQVLDFVAQQAGTYEFKCARVCGMHHGRMKGKLIVGE